MPFCVDSAYLGLGIWLAKDGFEELHGGDFEDRDVRDGGADVRSRCAGARRIEYRPSDLVFPSVVVASSCRKWYSSTVVD